MGKGAILSGFYALLKQANIDMSMLDKVLIAGQFGAHLPAESDVGTGILPEEVKDKLVYAGNASKTGAYMALMSVDVKERIEELANKIDYLEIGATEKGLNSNNSKLYRYIKLCFCYNINFQLFYHCKTVVLSLQLG